MFDKFASRESELKKLKMPKEKPKPRRRKPRKQPVEKPADITLFEYREIPDGIDQITNEELESLDFHAYKLIEARLKDDPAAQKAESAELQTCKRSAGFTC